MGFLQRFFHGRNGIDQLNLALLAVSLGCSLLGRILFRSLFEVLFTAIAFAALFRMVSRNIPKRRQENAAFLRWFRRLRRKSPRPGADKANFRHFKCPGCKQPLRAPKGKGKIKITCSKCGEVFYQEV